MYCGSSLFLHALINRLPERASSDAAAAVSLSTSSQRTETELIKCCQTFTLPSTASSDLLGLLDLSAAFDCVDHDILLCRLRIKFSIDGSALDWIRSFLLGRTQQVYYPGRMSVILQMLFGVPQGSVLGPVLFLLYTSELFDVVADWDSLPFTRRRH